MDMSESSDGESYAGSAQSIIEIRASAEVKLAEAINKSFDTLPLDRPIVIEMQHSGLLNADTRDILQLKEEADKRAALSTEKMAQMKSLVKKICANLEWLDRRTGNLEAKMKRAVPIEHAQAESKVVFREQGND